MQGNGGTMSGKAAADYAVQTVMSGPAAGALAAARIGQQSGHPNLIGCDMGGTSFDVTLIRAGEPALSAEKDIAYGVPIRVPMIDIHTIGAGGGSIARITKAGILQVGPDSAGANPGPICYGRGGTEPTVTDANLVLGKLDPAALPGVAGGVSIETVRAAIVDKIGRPLGLDAIAGGGGDPHRRQRSSGERHPPGVDREGLRSARLRAVRRSAARVRCMPWTWRASSAFRRCWYRAFPASPRRWAASWPTVRHDFVRTLNRPLKSVDRAEVDRLYGRIRSRGPRLDRGRRRADHRHRGDLRGRSSLSRAEPRDARPGQAAVRSGRRAEEFSRRVIASASTSS